MLPVTLRTARLLLSPPTLDDVDAITDYCQDPLFERYLTTPWPYVRADAEGYVEVVAARWADATEEFNWAIRTPDNALMGMIGWRTRGDVGFWMGAKHRGHGYMVEALATMVEWVFVEHAPERIEWETLPGNVASARVARAAGFRYTGIAPVLVPARDGSHPDSWHAELLRDDDRDPKPGWPL
ncbi:MAG: GNAT family N-acetyltransferase [Pseudolysinimonas sp.]